MNRRTITGLAVAAGYVLTIVAANWAIQNIGTPTPGGTRVVPVGFGHSAPAGVFFAGLAFTLRDVTQELLGKAATLAAIAAGCLVSFTLGDGRIALASALAFGASELADFAVYTPLRERGKALAVFASNVVGLVVDSALFLYAAFGSLLFIEGQIIGKLWTLVPAVAVAALIDLRRRSPRTPAIA